MAEHDDLETDLALSLVEAVDRGELDMVAEVIVGLDVDELRRAVPRLAQLVRLRASVGTEIASTAEWCAWLRRSMPGLVL